MQTRTATRIATVTETVTLTQLCRDKERDSRSPTPKPKFIPFSGVGRVTGTACATTTAETLGSACETTTEAISERAIEVEDSERQRPRRQLLCRERLETRAGTTSITIQSTVSPANTRTAEDVEASVPTSTWTYSPVHVQTRYTCTACMTFTLLAVQFIVLVVVISVGVTAGLRTATRMYWFVLTKLQ